MKKPDKICSIDGCGKAVASRGWCTKHYARFIRHKDPTIILRGENLLEDGVSRRCTQCKEVKPLEAFITRIRNGRVEYTACKPCLNTRARKRYAGMTHYTRRSTLLKYHYGMSHEAYELLWQQQGGRCAICETPDEARKLQVDHDHDTGQVRGLLCTPCNTRLAVIENTTWLQVAQSYLAHHQENARNKT